MHRHIYGLRLRGATEIRYVGASKRLEKRLKEELNAGTSFEFNKWIKDFGSEVEQVVLEECSENWKESETRWIKKLRAEGHRLFNSAGGGQGRDDYTPEERMTLSVAMKESWRRKKERDARMA